MTKWILVLALCACHRAPRATTPTPQTVELSARRAQMIEWLRDYHEAGVYPTDELGRPISVFEDARGVRCPMAELIHRSGHGDLVDEVAARDNHLRLADVKDGPLLDWMQQSGLTIEEIAMVQGVMPIDYIQLPGEAAQQSMLARRQIRGRLETAVIVLDSSTNHSVNVAAHRLAKKPITVTFPAKQPRAIRTVAEGAKAPILRP